MFSKALTAFLLAGAVVAQNLPVAAEGTPRCAIPHPSEQHIEDTKILVEIESLRAKLGPHVRRAPIVVDAYFHVVSSAKTKFITVSLIILEVLYKH